MSNNNDAAGVIAGILMVLFLLYLAVAAIVVLLAIGALLIVGWYITHLLIRLLDEASEGALVAEHGGLLLFLCGGLWSGVAWLFIRPHWLYALTDIWPNIVHYPVIIPLTGGALGLTWAMLVIFFNEQQAAVDPLDLSGMYRFTEDELRGEEPTAIDLLTDAVLLGTDGDS